MFQIRFGLRDILWVTVLIGICAGWWRNHEFLRLRNDRLAAVGESMWHELPLTAEQKIELHEVVDRLPVAPLRPGPWE